MYNIDGYTGIYGIVADPIKHSISPKMHNCAFKELKINDVYLAFELKENQFSDFIRSVKTLNIKGFNVSMPYKTKIIPYLDELTESAKLCGAVNTVKNRDGYLVGHITDGEGLYNAILNKGWHVESEKIVVLGAGGAANAIIVQLACQGAKEIVVYNRSDKAKIREFNKCLKSNIMLKLFDEEKLKNDLKDAYMLIHTTSVGMCPHIDECLITKDDTLSSHLKVIDVIYNPKETKLLKMAKNLGLECMNGEAMLLYQGASSFKFWTGLNMPVDIVKKELGME